MSSQLFAYRFTAQGGLGTPFDLQDASGTCFTAAAHTDASGRARVVWISGAAHATDSLPVSSRRFDGSNWGPRVALGAFVLNFGRGPFPINLSVDEGSGRYLAGWLLSGGVGTSGFVYVAGGVGDQVETPVTVLTGLPNPQPANGVFPYASPFASDQISSQTQQQVQVAVRHDGEALAAFNLDAAVRVMTRTPQGAWSAPIAVSPAFAGVSTEEIRVGYDAFDKPVLAWTTVLDATTDSGAPYAGKADNSIFFVQRQLAGAWTAPVPIVEHVTLPSLGTLRAPFGTPSLLLFRTGAYGVNLQIADDGPVAISWEESSGAVRARVLR